MLVLILLPFPVGIYMSFNYTLLIEHPYKYKSSENSRLCWGGRGYAIDK